MTWSKFDDAAAKCPKAVAAGNEAWSLWAAAVMYCNRHSTDGYISLAALANDCLPVPISVTKAKKLAERNCEAKVRPDGAGLFERSDGEFYRVHDFLDWNPSKDEVEAKRRSRAEAGRIGGLRSGEARSKDPPSKTEANASVNGKQPPSKPEARVKQNRTPPARPVPSRPPMQSAAAAAAVPPASLDKALDLPIADRARWCVQRSDVAEWVEPRLWPEVIHAANELGGAIGMRNVVLGANYARDSGLRTIVELFASGLTPEDLSRAARAAKNSSYFRDKRSLAAFTVEVVRRLLSEESRHDPYEIDPSTGALS